MLFTSSLFALVAAATASRISFSLHGIANTRAVQRAFEAANIPEDLAITFNPTAILDVSYLQTDGSTVHLHPGLNVPRNQTASAPEMALHFTDSKGASARTSGSFVVIMIDPDAPTPQNRSLSSVNHFIGGDFYPSDHGVLANSTAAVTEYRQPRPPQESAAHRYVFLAFLQSEEFASQTLVNADTSMFFFNVSQFAAETGLGSPIAGNFMFVDPAEDPEA
ncbi:PEBP-like protein [Mycena kentingensis (nom. inval.)]|nr:PEBP-like protein [Mycena kentingensis (nom. inval.)]